MQTWQSLKWLNRHGGSIALALMLFGFCAAAHVMAHNAMQMAGRHFVLMDSKTVTRMAIIDYIDAHPRVVLAYLILVTASLFRLELTRAPRWLVWCALIALALPGFAYAYGCFRIGAKVIF
jgi:hypothetical protein